jgi:hypothetical protein
VLVQKDRSMFWKRVVVGKGKEVEVRLKMDVIK